MEALVFGSSSTIRGYSLPLDTRHHLGNDDQVNDQRRGKKGVLADVEEPENGQSQSIVFETLTSTYEMVW